MTRVININTGTEREITTFECSICTSNFTEHEGGVQRGAIGMIAVSFCPTCLSGLFSMVDYLRGHTGDCHDDE